jgi:predicted nucleotidyltransferase
MENTKIIADTAVEEIEKQIRCCKFATVESIYVSGSYCRGDWLNSNSDLDINVIFDSNKDEAEINAEKNEIKEIVQKYTFDSHTPGGIDFGVSETKYIPKNKDDAAKANPYAYYSAFMFDLKANHKNIYGKDIATMLPEEPDKVLSCKNMIYALSERIKDGGTNDRKRAYNAYKIVQLLQMIYGECTINKYDILKLYEKKVPEFSRKWIGEMLIRDYVGSIYPEKPLNNFDAMIYSDFVDDIIRMMEKNSV